MEKGLKRIVVTLKEPHRKTSERGKWGTIYLFNYFFIGSVTDRYRGLSSGE